MWFVDGNNVGVLVEDGERVGGDWRLVTVNPVDQKIVVLQHRLHGNSLRIHCDNESKYK